MDEQVLKLIDELIAFWNKLPSHYRDNLIERIIFKNSSFLTSTERQIVSELHQRMSSEEYESLPKYMAHRWHQNEHQTHDDPRCQLCVERQIQIECEVIEQQRERERKERDLREKITASLNELFERDFLAADSQFADENIGEGVISCDDYNQLKASFVKSWAARVLKEELDLEQAAAVASINGNILVTARAGSGKTRTLVTRAIFLQKHCGVSPRELLLLAFNRAAVDEMKNRLRKALGNDLPHVMTFHALAHALVKPQERLLFDDQNSDQLGLSREVQSVIEEHIESDGYRELIKELMLAYFKEDCQRIVDGQLRTVEQLVITGAVYRVSASAETV